jgi:hypothetical protein
MGYIEDRSPRMILIIPLISTALALIQNLAVLALGMKEGALWYAPFSFTDILVAEVAVAWAAYLCTRRFIHPRRALVRAGLTVGALALAELALPRLRYGILTACEHSCASDKDDLERLVITANLTA